MEKLDIESYRRVNASFRRRMMYRIGVDCGFFVEMNYMVNAMLYCLAHRIRFQLYSEDANFGTGIGWTGYNFHRLPSWHNILRLCRKQKSMGAIAWKLKAGIKTMLGRLSTSRQKTA